MSIRHLDALFDPASIAVIGASLQPGHLGTTPWHNLTASYQGELFAVNPKYKELDGHPVLARVSDLPKAPDLAIICTPPASVAGLIDKLARLGTQAAVVLTVGMSPKQKKAMLDAARPHLLRLLGPHSIGFLVPHQGLNASASPVNACPGELAFVSQSGALVTAMLDWGQGRGIGFSHAVSLGEHADVDFGDMLDYLGSDPRTRACLLYVETIESPRKFMSAARAAARNKPVIVVKARRSLPGPQAALAHTGEMTGADLVFDAAIDRAGMLRVNTLQELFVAAETLSRFRTNTSSTLTVLSNGSGTSVMAADAADHVGVRLSCLSEVTQKKLKALLPADGSCTNPVNLGGDAPVARYEAVLKVLLNDPAAGAILLIHAPTADVPSADLAQALVALGQADAGRPPQLMSCWLGDQTMAAARQIARAADLASFDTPEQAVRAFSMLVSYRRNQAELTEAPPALQPGWRLDTVAIQALVKQVLADGRDLLTPAETQTLLAACGVVMAPAEPLPGGERRLHARELYVGSTIDPVFGPVILFGLGGTAMEVMADRAVALPPLNIPLAKALVSRTRVARLLTGWRDPSGLNEAALHGVLVAVSQLLAEIPEIAELAINPLVVNFEGAMALGARIRLRADAPAGAKNFAIQPYPTQLEETVQWQGQTLCLRPIRPEDEALHTEFLQQLTPDDIRMRVFYSKRSMERSELARLVQIDYAREMAFIAVATGPLGQPQTLGVVRAVTDPDNIEAEFGVIVRSGLKGGGLGRLLMEKLIAYLRTQGTQRLVATVLDYNTRMLQLAQDLGFEEVPASPDDDGTKSIVLRLT